ncbi:MAG: cytochrome c [Burkholderiaceae bacterium]|jgi:mono/diheme cytochrome c family protein|nr:cytochrome c [Burkholderiaceae bacterium]
MHSVLTTCALAACVLLLLVPVPSAQAQPQADPGSREYAAHCAECHGPTGVGDGPRARDSKLPVPDLTRLAQRAGGSFPTERVRRVIDGRDDIKGHAGRSMPAWGLRYARAQPGEGEAAVTQRLDALLGHLRGLQR